ncbi:MAG: oligosaccharide flippase family protein [Desulfosarcina sp.]|nr:oligosaccharide flippase family protein [Desulfosarcina sp.]MBC2764913.1 oligosaccharide flippase family protein [Desulfosarcina sp.]
MWRVILTSRALSILFVHAAVPLTNFLVVALLARGLSDSDLDHFLYLYNLALLMSAISDFGLRNTTYAEVARHRWQTDVIGILLGRTYTAKGVLSLCVVVTFSALALGQQSANLPLFLMFALVAVTLYPSDPAVGALRGLEASQYELPLTVLEKLLVFTGLYALLKAGRMTELLAATVLWVPAAARAILGFTVVRREAREAIKPASIRSAFILVRQRTGSGIGLFIYVLYLRLPVLLAPYVGLASDVSGVTIALMIAQVVLSVPSILIHLMVPTIFKMAKDSGAARLRRTVVPVLVGCFGVGLLLGAAFFWQGDFLFRLVVGADVENATILAGIVAAAPFIAVNQAVRLLLVADRKDWSAVGGVTCGLVLQFCALSFGAAFDGIEGFVAGYLLAEGLLSVAGWGVLWWRLDAKRGSAYR